MSDAEIASLVRQFFADTNIHCSMVSVSHKPSVQALLAHGMPVVEYVFRNNVQLTYHLMDALATITGENPIKPEHAGIISEMREDWHQWAAAHNYR